MEAWDRAAEFLADEKRDGVWNLSEIPDSLIAMLDLADELQPLLKVEFPQTVWEDVEKWAMHNVLAAMIEEAASVVPTLHDGGVELDHDLIGHDLAEYRHVRWAEIECISGEDGKRTDLIRSLRALADRLDREDRA